MGRLATARRRERERDQRERPIKERGEIKEIERGIKEREGGIKERERQGGSESGKKQIRQIQDTRDFCEASGFKR